MRFPYTRYTVQGTMPNAIVLVFRPMVPVRVISPVGDRVLTRIPDVGRLSKQKRPHRAASLSRVLRFQRGCRRIGSDGGTLVVAKPRKGRGRTPAA
jgi:hypothetical protein